ncbi:DUF2505 family protein [Polyangium aurulentum]|uniref:DUF2505 family protein n=1 Tax=Polyangium aurulentum TaxID=2567896 RepID=UPI0010AEE1FE|nr:DUF2505 family protein [Polyangium aurulentum]UQA61316.1 DUF2505 family protein [Polyangium aurulentum]
MRFEITHEFDAPLDAVELAVLSPDLGQMMVSILNSNIESVETVEHVIEGGELRRVLRFQASAPLPIFRGHNVAREAMSWEELSVYRLADHSSTWSVAPREQWRRYFRSEGTYRLEAVPGGRTKRTVVGDIEIKLGMIAPLVERMALAEVRKTYDAEAQTLMRLSTL